MTVNMSLLNMPSNKILLSLVVINLYYVINEELSINFINTLDFEFKVVNPKLQKVSFFLTKLKKIQGGFKIFRYWWTFELIFLKLNEGQKVDFFENQVKHIFEFLLCFLCNTYLVRKFVPTNRKLFSLYGYIQIIPDLKKVKLPS